MTDLTAPRQLPARALDAHWTALPAVLPVPGQGALAVNSFLLRGPEPLLVDTGLGALGEDFLASLSGQLDPASLRWIWLSHLDADHAGNLERLLAVAPRARVLTGFLGAGKMGLAGLDTSRVDLLSPGQAIEIGGHRLQPVRPPYYDAPETMGFYDTRTRALFVVDAFGALLPGPAEAVPDLPDAVLADGLRDWSALDAPWLAGVDRERLRRTLDALVRLDPARVLAAHLPAEAGPIARLAAQVDAAWCRHQAPWEAPVHLPAPGRAAA